MLLLIAARIFLPVGQNDEISPPIGGEPISRVIDVR